MSETQEFDPVGRLEHHLSVARTRAETAEARLKEIEENNARVDAHFDNALMDAQARVAVLREALTRISNSIGVSTHTIASIAKIILNQLDPAATAWVERLKRAEDAVEQLIENNTCISFKDKEAVDAWRLAARDAP